MARIGLAFRAFFRILRDAAVARQVEQVLAGKALPAPAPLPVSPPRAKTAPARSEALDFLAVLQREGRLVDFLKEDIAPYSDAQVGAAVRDVHRDCAAAVERLFALRPVRGEAEGTNIEVPAGFDASRLRLTGNVSGQPPYRGALRHGGWEAAKVDLPQWTGSPDAARVVAPAEIEVS